MSAYRVTLLKIKIMTAKQMETEMVHDLTKVLTAIINSMH
jgi:hypothetical protein